MAFARGDDVNLQQEIALLLDNRTRFTTRGNDRDAKLLRGEHLRQHALTEIVGTLDDAVEWLRRQRDLSMA
jgi:hypothetical protein